MTKLLISLLSVFSMVALGAVPSTLYPVPNDSTMTLQIKSTAALAEMFNLGIPVTLSNSVSGTLGGNVGGFTLITNLILVVDTTAGGIAANDVLAPGLQITGAVRKTGGTGILKCVSYVSGDNNAPAFRLLICSQPITWPVTNAVANLRAADFPYILGVVDFTTAVFRLVGTNYVASVDSSIGITCETNSLFIYAVNTAAITNYNSGRIKPTIFQD